MDFWFSEGAHRNLPAGLSWIIGFRIKREHSARSRQLSHAPALQSSDSWLTGEESVDLFQLGFRFSVFRPGVEDCRLLLPIAAVTANGDDAQHRLVRFRPVLRAPWRMRLARYAQMGTQHFRAALRELQTLAAPIDGALRIITSLALYCRH